ncbi:MAG: PBP1A family penicillin-binding protein [Thermaerobacter sp.]|nr:PBP1A family penicillin-binding protein [Thermaerobacter sp.]
MGNRAAAKTSGKPKGRRRIRWGRVLLLAAGILLVSGAGVFAWTLYSLPPIGSLNASGGSSVIYDSNGKVITTLHGVRNSIPVPLQQMPTSLQDAVISIEDHNFYRNQGFDLLSIARAALVDLKAGLRPVQGASTITEQLAKNLYLSDQKTLSRKLKEFVLGIELNRNFTKQEILQKYLNTIYFGQGAYGVEAASRAYFGVGVRHLDLAQSAMLAGLIDAPSANDPLANFKGAKTRQTLVLHAMAKYGYITQAQEHAALAETLHFAPSSASTSYPAPYFVDYVIEYLNVKLGLSMNEIYHGGLRIYTTLDMHDQTAAEDAVAQVMNRAFPMKPGQPPNPQAAALIMDPHNGHILAMVGGRTHTGLLVRNRTISGLGPYEGMLRQPGSSIKPLYTYTAAIASGLTEMTVMDDVPFSIVKGKIWPENDDHLFRGYMTLRHALAISDNNVAVKTLNHIGVDTGFNFALNKFHLHTLVGSGAKNDRTLAATLGGLTKGVSLKEMVSAYSELDNGGIRVSPVAILKVLRPDGSALYQYRPHEQAEFSPQVAYIVTKMLEKVFAYGTGSGFPLNRPAAGKTGTTNHGHNGWFMGYTPQLVAGVWVGYSDTRPKPNFGFYGATYAGPIWHALMTTALAGQPVEHFSRPSGIVQVAVSVRSGLLPGPYCPPQDIKEGLFIQGTQPTTQGNIHVPAVVCANNPKLLWDPSCGCQPVTKVFWRRPTNLLQIPSSIPPPQIIAAAKWAPDTSCTGGTGSTGPPSTSSGPLIIAIANGAVSPQTVQASLGQKAQLDVLNTSHHTYTFSLPSLHLQQAIPPNNMTTFSFTPSTKGSFPFTATTAGKPTLSGVLQVQ